MHFSLVQKRNSPAPTRARAQIAQGKWNIVSTIRAYDWTGFDWHLAGFWRLQTILKSWNTMYSKRSVILRLLLRLPIEINERRMHSCLRRISYSNENSFLSRIIAPNNCFAYRNSRPNFLTKVLFSVNSPDAKKQHSDDESVAKENKKVAKRRRIISESSSSDGESEIKSVDRKSE